MIVVIIAFEQGSDKGRFVNLNTGGLSGFT
jgi:hypothetical protein